MAWQSTKGGFKDDSATHTPLNTEGRLSKLRQNTATEYGHRTVLPTVHYTLPPGGRLATSGSPSPESQETTSKEGSRSVTQKEVHGKVLIAGNHPNKKLKSIYG